jgi:formylglycine-generating enzyme required for sulfatase activity
MAGNAHEWCSDWFMTEYYRLKEAKRNPEGPTEEQAELIVESTWKAKCRLVRGGSWYYLSNLCRSTRRLRYYPSGSYHDGFRIALSPGR